jgi:hypothetical protein
MQDYSLAAPWRRQAGPRFRVAARRAGSGWAQPLTAKAQTEPSRYLPDTTANDEFNRSIPGHFRMERSCPGCFCESLTGLGSRCRWLVDTAAAAGPPSTVLPSTAERVNVIVPPSHVPRPLPRACPGTTARSRQKIISTAGQSCWAWACVR